MGRGQIGRSIKLYKWMKRGFLPAPGALVEQSHTMLEAYELIDRLFSHHQQKRAEREKS